MLAMLCIACGFKIKRAKREKRLLSSVTDR